MGFLRTFRSHLLWRMICWYFLFLLLPCLLFAGIYFAVNRSYYAEEKRQLEQTALTRCRDEIEESMELCSSVFLQITQHSNFLRFLNGGYSTVSAQLEAYYKEFSRMFTYAETYSPLIDRVTVYALRDDLLQMNHSVTHIDELGPFTFDQQTSTGYWRYDSDAQRFIFRKTLYSVAGDKELAILEISCHPEIVSQPVSRLSSSVSRGAYVVYEDTPYLFQEEVVFSLAGEPDPSDPSAQCSLLPARICLSTHTEQGQGEWLNALSLTTFLGLFAVILFSIVYFVNVSKLSRRIVDFAKYLSHSYEVVPEPYQDGGSDEFSLLVQNFNVMLENNSHLVSQVKLEKLRQDEMAYHILQAQIDPHFIYNSLESIRMMAEIHNDSETADAIFSLSRLLRYTFSVNMGEVPIAQELDLVEQYMKIQQLRLGDGLTFRLHCPKALARYRCPQFIVQPLVENAVKYGRNQRHLTVSVSVSLREDRLLVIQVSNDGASMDPEKMAAINQRLQKGMDISQFSSGTGIGLDNVNRRMRHLYPDSFQMELQPAEHASGLTVTLAWEPRESPGIVEEE